MESKDDAAYVESSGDELSPREMDDEVKSDSLESNANSVEEDNIYMITSKNDDELDAVGIKYDDIEIESNLSGSETDDIFGRVFHRRCGGTHRADIHDNYMNYVKYTQYAVDKYNSRFKINGNQLELVKINEVKRTLVAGYLLHVTFDAIDFGDGMKIKTYQAKIWWKISRKVKVLSFGLRPFYNRQEDDQVTWFWKDR